MTERTNISEWRQDPEGHEYRIHFDEGTVEYKPKAVSPNPDLKPFTVVVRGKEYHVSAKDEDSAMEIFRSGALPSLPKEKEVSIK